MSAHQAGLVPNEGTHGFFDGLVGADGLLVALDFDGTLVPLANDPTVPTITGPCRRALRSIVTHPQARAAVISGREQADLRDRVGLPGVVYAGNHGLQLSWEGHDVVHPLAARYRPSIEHAGDWLASVLADVPGCLIEHKGLTVTIHVRETPTAWIDRVRSAVARAARDAAGRVRVTSGKQVFELRPAVAWDKGSVIAELSGRVPDGWQTVYVGDDRTDEDGFRALGEDGTGVLVGRRTSTEATYRLPNQAAVAPFLHELVAWLRGNGARRARLNGKPRGAEFLR